MARDVIEGRALSEFPVTTCPVDYLSEVSARLLSKDDQDGAFSAYIETTRRHAFSFPVGRTLELFVLSGSITANGIKVPQGQFVYLPPQGANRAIELHANSTLFFATGEKDVGGGEFEIVDPETKAWEVRTSPCAFSSTGVSTNVVKYLRIDAENRNNFGIDVMWPGSGLDCTEWHDVADEVFRLSGDLLLLDPVTGRPVEAGPGSYAWRPLDSKHLPKYSHTGCVQLFRNREWPAGKVGMGYEPAPEWPQHLKAYKQKFPIMEPVDGLVFADKEDQGNTQ